MNPAFVALSEAEQVEILADMARRALPAWGDAPPSLSLLKYRENVVFRAERDGVPIAVLRLHRPGYRQEQHIRSEAQWTDALRGAGIPTPEMIPTEAGDVVSLAPGNALADARPCDRLAWVEGSPLGSLERGVDLDAAGVRSAYVTIGELAGRLHAQADTWKVPVGFERPAWDLDSLVGEAPTFGKFWELDVLDDEQRSALLHARDRVRAGLAALGPATQLIHGDLIPDNVLVAGDRMNVIDFDDCGWSWPLCELATSLFPLLVNGGFDVGLEGFLDGYRRHRPFAQEEVDLLPLMLAARTLSYLGWPVGRPEIHSQRQGLGDFAAAAVALVQALVE